MEFSDFGNKVNEPQGFNFPEPAYLQEQEHYFGNNFNMFNPEKKNDIANWKTGDYQIFQQQPIEEKEEYFPDFSNPPDAISGAFGGFPSTGLLGNNNFPDFMNISNNDKINTEYIGEPLKTQNSF